MKKISKDYIEKSGQNMDDIGQNLKYIPDPWGTVRALGIDTYPGEMAIVRELIQNADDSIDKEKKLYPKYIKFIIKQNELIIEHDGKPFTKPPEHLLGKENLTDKERNVGISEMALILQY